MLTYEEQKALYNLKAFPALLKKTSQNPTDSLKSRKYWNLLLTCDFLPTQDNKNQRK